MYQKQPTGKLTTEDKQANKEQNKNNIEKKQKGKDKA